MKIRAGFVSNSSSSSYVVIVEKEAFNNIFATLSPLEKDLVSWLGEGLKPQPFLDKEVIVLEWFSGNISTIENYSPGDGNTGYVKGSEEYESDIVGDCLYDLQNKLKKLPGNVAKVFYQSDS